MRIGHRDFQTVGTFLPLTALLAATFVLGLTGIGATRALFVVGCVAVSLNARRHGTAVHLQTIIALFCLAPLLRRVADLHAGYEATGLMLTGPFLALLIPAVELRDLLRPGRAVDPSLHPFVIVGACVTYAAFLSVFTGNFVGAASGALKWIAPLLYGAWLYERAWEEPGLPAAAARAFVAIMPFLGIYGVVQYVDPPAWDRYWMLYTPIWSIGLPEPYAVRVFSTMNSPASFATYTCCALLLIGICRVGWTSALVAIPCTIGLLLSLYRTAWVALAAGLVVSMLSPATRRRAVLLAAVAVAAGVVTLVATPFGDVIASRLGTLTQGGGDYSVEERLREYSILLDADDGTLFGHGFAAADVGQAGALSIDGQTVACWYIMGLPVGLVCLAAIIWATWQAIARTTSNLDPARAVLGALVATMLVQIPLASIATGEMGVLFWGFVGIACARSPRTTWTNVAARQEIVVAGQP